MRTWTWIGFALCAACGGGGAAADTGSAVDGDTGSDGSAAVTASGGDSPTAQYTLQFLALVDEDEDGRWEIGESARLDVQLTNQGEDDFAYPECVLSSEDLASGPGPWTLFGVPGGQSEVCTFALEHLTDAVAGDTVAMEVVVHRLNCTTDCPEENPLSLEVTLVAPDG